MFAREHAAAKDSFNEEFHQVVSTNGWDPQHQCSGSGTGSGSGGLL